jgi:hypothetical protein
LRVLAKKQLLPPTTILKTKDRKDLKVFGPEANERTDGKAFHMHETPAWAENPYTSKQSISIKKPNHTRLNVRVGDVVRLEIGRREDCPVVGAVHAILPNRNLHEQIVLRHYYFPQQVELENISVAPEKQAKHIAYVAAASAQELFWTSKYSYSSKDAIECVVQVGRSPTEAFQEEYCVHKGYDTFGKRLVELDTMRFTPLPLEDFAVELEAQYIMSVVDKLYLVGPSFRMLPINLYKLMIIISSFLHFLK